MDFEALRGAMEAAVPYNSHLRLQVVEIGDGHGVVRLADDERLRNHTGSQHASALYSAGQAASAAAVVGAFGDDIGGIEPNVVAAEITHTGIARGPIDAVATLAEPSGEVRARLQSDGTASFDVGVVLVNGGESTVAELLVHWTVDRRSEG